MGRPKLNESDKKIKVSITLDKDLNDQLNKITNNKSKLIGELLETHIKENE
jgi:metal-responsive CopG/Arc/MetJ family transcriptional regulator